MQYTYPTDHDVHRYIALGRREHARAWGAALAYVGRQIKDIYVKARG